MIKLPEIYTISEGMPFTSSVEHNITFLLTPVFQSDKKRMKMLGVLLSFSSTFLKTPFTEIATTVVLSVKPEFLTPLNTLFEAILFLEI